MLSDKPVVSFGIQEEGGTIKTAALAVEAARKMVEEASKLQKVECDASDLFVAIECGGSDATSGIASIRQSGVWPTKSMILAAQR